MKSAGKSLFLPILISSLFITNVSTLVAEEVSTQIPEEKLGTMSTDQLIEEYMISLVRGNWFAYDYMDEAFEQATRDFNGLRELLKRDDAAQKLIEFYQKMDPSAYSESWDLSSRGAYVFSFIYLEALLAQDSMRNRMTNSQIDVVLAELLNKYRFKHLHNNMYSLYSRQFNVYALARFLELKQESDESIHTVLQMTDTQVLLKTGRLHNINTLTIVINTAQDYLKKNSIVSDDWVLEDMSLGKRNSENILEQTTTQIHGYTEVDLYTPEGKWTQGYECTFDFQYEWEEEELIDRAQDKIDEYDLNAVMISGPSHKYNCAGYAYWHSEGNKKARIVDYPDRTNFWTDGAYSNDGQPSYIAANESEATHANYTDVFHPVRKIQNSYPVAVEGGRDYVSKWGDMGLYQHAKDHDYFHEGYDRPKVYKILKTTHYGTLTNYPKTWIGAGGITHNVTSTLTVPTGVNLTIESDATVAIAAGVSLVVNGTLTICPNSTISFGTGSSLVINGALNDSSNLVIPSGASLVANSGSVLTFANGAKLTVNGTLNAIGTSSSMITFDFTAPSGSYRTEYATTVVPAVP